MLIGSALILSRAQRNRILGRVEEVFRSGLSLGLTPAFQDLNQTKVEGLKETVLLQGNPT